jgi:hypothetical protein
VKLTYNGAVQFLTIGKIAIPVRNTIGAMVEDVRRLSRKEHAEIIKDAGMEVVPGMESRKLSLLAMSLIQNEWYEVKGLRMTKTMMARHVVRVSRFKQDVEELKRNPPVPRQKTARRQLEITGTPERSPDPREVVEC